MEIEDAVECVLTGALEFMRTEGWPERDFVSDKSILVAWVIIARQ